MKTLSLFTLGTLLVVLIAGCDTGTAQNNNDGLQNQITLLTNQIEGLKTQVETANSSISALQSQPGNGANSDAGGSSIRIGFVNAEEVFIRYQGTEAAIEEYGVEKADKESQLQDLQDQFSSGALDASTFQSRQQSLINELAELDQKLTNDITLRIVNAVEYLGLELDFELITARKNVILFFKENGVVEDLTEQVLEYMNNNIGSGE